ncbi:MAG: metal-dependent hydrolase, partial [Candidatus Dormibacteraceae bacterium]
SILALAVVTVAAGLATAAWAPQAALEVAAVVGAAYLSHLLADSVNPTPLALLWPWPGCIRPSWLPAVIEDSWRGRAVEAVVTVAIVGLVGWRLWEAMRR